MLFLPSLWHSWRFPNFGNLRSTIETVASRLHRLSNAYFCQAQTTFGAGGGADFQLLERQSDRGYGG